MRYKLLESYKLLERPVGLTAFSLNPAFAPIYLKSVVHLLL